MANINIPDSVRTIRYDILDDTFYYRNRDNWVNGTLCVDNYLIAVAKGTKRVILPDNIHGYSLGAYSDCRNTVKIVTIGGGVNSAGVLSELTNVETVIIDPNTDYFYIGNFFRGNVYTVDSSTLTIFRMEM